MMDGVTGQQPELGWPLDGTWAGTRPDARAMRVCDY